MTLLYELNAEILAEGVTITNANSALDADAAGTNNTATAALLYGNTPNVRGVKLKFGTVGVNGGIPTNGMALQKNLAGAGSGNRNLIVFKGLSFTNINTQLDMLTFRSAAGASTARLRKLDDGRLQLIGTSTASPFGTTTFALAAATDYDLQVSMKIGASTGTMDLQVTATGSTTVLASLAFTAQALGTDLIAGIRWGSSNIPTAATEYGFDSIEIHDLATGFVAATVVVPRVYGRVTPGYGLIDLTGNDLNDTDAALTFAFTPSLNVRPTNNAYFFTAPSGTYSVVGTNASSIQSAPVQIVVPATATPQSVILRKWDATAAAYI